MRRKQFLKEDGHLSDAVTLIGRAMENIGEAMAYTLGNRNITIKQAANNLKAAMASVEDEFALLTHEQMREVNDNWQEFCKHTGTE